MDFDISKDKDFVPSSEKKIYTISIRKNKLDVPHISVQDGYIGEEIAARIFYKDQLKRIWRGPPKDRRFILERYGIIDLQSAQNLRESALKNIVETLFEKKGWIIYREPSLMEFKPDLLVKKENFSIIIELKAYRGTLICREAEIAQAIKYYDKLSSICELNLNIFAIKKKIDGKLIPELIKIDNLPKVLLITSGMLISEDFFNFLKRRTENEVFDELVEQRYKELMSKINNFDALDQRDAYGIYKSAIKKWKKISWDHLFWISNFFYDPLADWEKVLSTDKSNIILISNETFLSILTHENLKQEIKLFELLQKTPLEEIMIDPTILKV